MIKEFGKIFGEMIEKSTTKLVEIWNLKVKNHPII
jgi:hypothetical protein